MFIRGFCILKDLADVIARPTLYQRSWESVEFPDDWKLANVIAIYKKGTRQDTGNDRSVSLASGPGKLTEKIILGDI